MNGTAVHSPLARVVAVLTAALLLASVVPPALGMEPGWPASHQPVADPARGDAGYLSARDALPLSLPRPMTDADFMAKDPDGFAAVTAGRAMLESALLRKVRAHLKAGGVKVSSAAYPSEVSLRAADLLADSPWSPYGLLRFRLVPSTSPYARNGYLGTLYFSYGIYSCTADAYRWFTVAWPARSGNNRPADQSRIGVGPIPEYRWAFGFMCGEWRGYEPDGREAFYPGKWRLDPWTGGPYGRCYLEVHGGVGAHEFGATSGCIRLYSRHVAELRVYYDSKMANKADTTAPVLTVDY